MDLRDNRTVARRTILSLSSLLVYATVLHAQSFTINGTTDAVGPSGTDYASSVIGDPWDFNEVSDYTYMLSDDGTTASAFTSVPGVPGGVLTGTLATGIARLQMIFEGIAGGLNTVGKNGIVYPIDGNRFRRLSFRVRRSAGAPVVDELLGVLWAPALNRAAGGLKLVRAQGPTPGGTYANMSLATEQGAAKFHIYRIDIDEEAPGLAQGVWPGIQAGLLLQVANTGALRGSSVELDWVRLTERGPATARTLSWNGLGNSVRITAVHAQTGDVIQIYPDSTNGTQTFPANSSYNWDFGYLPPGTWTLTAQGTSAARTATLTINAAPVVNVLDPDAAGGRDFATSVLGDGWDLTNPQDVTRFGRVWQMSSPQFTEQGLIGVTTGGQDPFVQFIDDWDDRAGTAFTLDATTYHRLSFTLEYDHKELMLPQSLSGFWGGVARVAWSREKELGIPYTVTQDLVVFDGGPQTFTMDLASFRDTSTLEEPITTPWQGRLPTFRIDTDEAATPRTVRVSNVRLAADDEPNGNGMFVVRWRAFDATFSQQVSDGGGADATVAVFLDTDLDPTARILLAQEVPATAGALAFSLAGQPAGLYYIFLQVTDGAGNTQGRYSSGPIRVASPMPAPTDSDGDGLADAWEARYGATNPNADNDGDGAGNYAEYLFATHPLVPNSWTLAEGATGFFAQRIVLANPDATPADMVVTFLRPAPNPPIVREYSVAPFGRVTINVNEVAGLGLSEVSAIVSARTGGVVAERTMFWGDQLYGGHTGKALQRPGTQWFLAEGAASDFFSTFILLANPGGTPATATLTFLLEGGGTVVKQYAVPASSRVTVFTNDLLDATGNRALFNRAFSTTVSSTVPIAVERAMYFSGGRIWNGGHGVAAVEAPQQNWYVAEGATGGYFAMFLLLGNPNPFAVSANLRYLLPGGAFRDEAVALPALSRTTISVHERIQEGDVSVAVSATAGILVERAMYWPIGGWYEAHASAGLTTTGTQWALAEGELGGARGFQSFVLIANPSQQAAAVQLRFLVENGGSFLSAPFTVPANGRVTRSAGEFVGPGQLGSGSRFGVLVESLNGVPIVVERAMYWNVGSEIWGGGTNESGVRIR